MAEPTYDDDPGWPLGWLMLLAALWPPLLFLTLRKRSGDALVTVRQIFVSFVLALFLFQRVLATMTPGNPERAPVAVGLLAIGALSVFVATPLATRQAQLDCTNEAKLAGTYFTRFFIRVAFAEAAALYGFVGFFIANVWWVYPSSLVLAVVGMARLAPTKKHLAADQAELRGRGCSLSLVQALRQPKAA